MFESFEEELHYIFASKNFIFIFYNFVKFLEMT